MMTAQVDYGVRVKRAYANMVVGRVIFPPALERDMLVQKGFCERMSDPDETPQPPKRRAERD